MIELAYDTLSRHNIGHPNLARHQAWPFTQSWREFGNHYPFTVPLRLCHYLEQTHIPYTCSTVQDASHTAWYPIAWAWFDFSIDYLSLIPPLTMDRIRTGSLRVLFYYHEGDNPQRIHQRLTSLAQQHQIPCDRFTLITANTACADIPGQCYFDDHEHFFRYINRHQTVCDHDKSTPTHDFTIVSRKPCWWRISILADLWGEELLQNSLWSFDLSRGFFDKSYDNPISVHEFPELPSRIDRLREQVYHRCDSLDQDQQNDHHVVNLDLYTNSFFHIVLETHFDADQSGGTFLTEKTYKCIKYRQPFLIAGTQGSIKLLRQHGYRVFDGVIDHSYDDEPDSTKRWAKLRSEIARIKTIGTKILYEQCESDLDHNCELFHTRGPQSLSILLRYLNEKNS